MKIIYTITEAEHELSTIKNCEVCIDTKTSEDTVAKTSIIKLGTESIKKTFDIDVTEPPIPFSKKELAEASARGDYLILRVDTLIAEKIHKIVSPKVEGKMLYDTSWYKKEMFFTKERPTAGWVLVSNTLLEGSKGKTWHGQESMLTEIGAHRRSFVEFLYDWSLIYCVTGKRMLEGFEYEWTSSVSSDGSLVRVGNADSRGSGVGRSEPGLSDSNLGVSSVRSS